MAKPTKPALIATLEKQIGMLKRERNALKEKCEDLADQNLTLSKNPVLTVDQKMEFTRLRDEWDEANRKLNRLSEWLRVNRAGEIAAGKHTGKDLVDVVIGYMETGKEAGNAQ